jgi:hypothetical protein
VPVKERIRSWVRSELRLLVVNDERTVLGFQVHYGLSIAKSTSRIALLFVKKCRFICMRHGSPDFKKRDYRRGVGAPTKPKGFVVEQYRSFVVLCWTGVPSATMKIMIAE